MEPNSPTFDCVPDVYFSSNEYNVIEVMACNFQGQFIKETASTCVPLAHPLHHVLKLAAVLWGCPSSPVQRDIPPKPPLK